MVLLSFSRLAALYSALAVLTHAAPSPPIHWLKGDVHPFNHGGLTAASDAAKANGVPVRERSPAAILSNPDVKLDKTARDILARATPVPPHFLVYGDRSTPGTIGPPDASLIQGFNVFALAFLLTTGPADKAAQWTTLNATQRAAVKTQYAAAGIQLIVSAFGSTEAPTTNGVDPIATANTMAAFVIDFDLDGIDVDYEDFNAFDVGGGSAETWLTQFTTQLRTQLPLGQFILTHAPVAPWFSPNKWVGGGYLQVHQNVGSLIDWYNIQFYNQGRSEYTTCAGLLNQSTSTWPESAVFQIIANGVDSSKVVIGKPATSKDAHSGFIDPSTLAGCVEQAHAQGWDAGVMVWEYPDAGASWIQTVRSQAFPV